MSEQHKPFTVYKDADGVRYMLVVTSNSYQDREGEYLSTEALKGYVDSQWSDDKWAGDNVLLFWHDGPPIGDIVHADMEGPFLFEVAQERQSGLPLIKAYTGAMWDYVENHPDEQWGASHGFGYLPEDKEMTDDGPVYHKIRKYETSILPLEYAANAYTISGVVQMSENKARDEKLDGIMPGWGDKLRSFLGLEKGELDEAGIEHKALGPQITQQDFADALTAAVKMVAIKADEGEEVTLKDVVQDVAEAFMEVPAVSLEAAEEILAVEDATDADTDEPDAEPVEESAEHEHTEPEPDELEKALTKSVAFNEQLMTDQKAIVDVLGGMAETLKGLVDLPERFSEVEKNVTAMQAEFEQRPRASRSTATLVSEEVAKELGADDEPKKWFGKYPATE